MLLHWHLKGHDGVLNHRRFECLLIHMFKRRSMKTSKFCVTSLFVGKPSVTDGFPSQRTSNAENVSIWWCQHGTFCCNLSWLTKISTMCVRARVYLFAFSPCNERSCRWQNFKIIITRVSEVILFSPCVFVCLCLYHDDCLDDLTMKDWCHTNNILQVHCWGCLVVQDMFHALMTSSMTSPDHKVGQILKLIYLHQYLS